MARAGIIYYTISSLDQEENEWRSTALNQSNPINYSRSLCLVLINSDLMGISWWWSCCCAFLHSRRLPLIHNTDIKRYSDGRRLHSSADVNVGNIAGGTKEKYSTPVGGREAKIIYIPAVGPLRALSLAVPQHTSIGSKGGWRHAGQDEEGWKWWWLYWLSCFRMVTPKGIPFNWVDSTRLRGGRDIWNGMRSPDSRLVYWPGRVLCDIKVA